MVTTPFRGEHWELSYGQERVTAGTAAPNAALKGFLGVFDRAQLPDPEVEWQAIYGAGGMTNRNFFRQIRGNWTMTGNVSDVILLHATPMQYIFGNTVYHYASAYTGAASNVAADVAAGATGFNLPAGHAVTSGVIQIGATGDGSRNAFEINRPELRTATVSSNAVTFSEPLNYAHLAADTTTDGYVRKAAALTSSSFYGHVILESTTLPTMTWLSSMWRAGDTAATPTLIRKYMGGKVARGSIRAEEGERLRLNLDDIIFTDMRYNDERSSAPSPDFSNKYDNALTRIAPTIPNLDPFFASSVAVYYNADGANGLAATDKITSVRNMQLEVNNNAEARYYVAGHDPATPTAHSVIEGNREYTLNLTVDPQDSNFYATMLQASKQELSDVTDVMGFQIRIFATRTGHTTYGDAFSGAWTDGIRIDIPEPSAATNHAAINHATTYKGDLSASNQGAILRTGPLAPGGDPVIQQELDFAVRTARVEVHDANTWETL